MIQNNTVKGLLLGLLFWTVLGLPFTLRIASSYSSFGTMFPEKKPAKGQPVKKQPVKTPVSSGVAVMALGVGGILALMLFSGGFLGFFAGRIQARRRLKMIFLSLFVYWLDAFIVGTCLAVFGSIAESDGMSVLEMISGGLYLSLAGSFLFGIFLAPLMIAGGLILEWWCRPAA